MLCRRRRRFGRPRGRVYRRPILLCILEYFECVCAWLATKTPSTCCKKSSGLAHEGVSSAAAALCCSLSAARFASVCLLLSFGSHAFAAAFSAFSRLYYCGTFWPSLLFKLCLLFASLRCWKSACLYNSFTAACCNSKRLLKFPFSLSLSLLFFALLRLFFASLLQLTGPSSPPASALFL